MPWFFPLFLTQTLSISKSLVFFIRWNWGLPGLELRSAASNGSFPTREGGQATSETLSNALIARRYYRTLREAGELQ